MKFSLTKQHTKKINKAARIENKLQKKLVQMLINEQGYKKGGML